MGCLCEGAEVVNILFLFFEKKIQAVKRRGENLFSASDKLVVYLPGAPFSRSSYLGNHGSGPEVESLGKAKEGS